MPGVAHQAALDAGGYEYGVWPRNDGEASGADLSQFCIVIWNLGWGFPTLTPGDRDALTAYLDGGGKLFVSGQDLGWALNDTVNSGEANAQAIDCGQRYRRGGNGGPGTARRRTMTSASRPAPRRPRHTPRPAPNPRY